MTDSVDQPAGERDGAPVEEPHDADALEREISRRKLLAGSIGVMSGAIALGVGVPAALYVTGPTREQQTTQEWIQMGAIASVSPGAPTLMKATVERRSGYLTTNEEVAVFVTTENGVDFVAMSNVCTHLGCRVRWVPDQDGFFCPCHNGVFDAEGAVVSGPPPRPLDRFETKVEDGRLFVRQA
jgi:Rieske Fe-S protein